MNGEILSETDSPIYSKFNPDSGAWISASEIDAECVVVNGKRCSIFGKSCAGSEIVFVRKIDAADKLKKVSADNLDIIKAVMELDKKQNILFNIVTALNKSLEELKSRGEIA